MNMTPSAPGLNLLRLLPDMSALARWAAATGQRALREDTGYALHAALRATLGEVAPRPFALLQRPGSLQLIGYTAQPAPALLQAISLAAASDPGAAGAVGLLDAQEALVTPMPAQWQSGQRLSFEVRVAPVVRSRQAQGGGYPEVDAAFHPDYCADQPGDRQAAHGRWLARELARGGAATLLAHRALAFGLSPMARRSARVKAVQPQRPVRQGLLPDLTVRGQLRVDDPVAFNLLLARGLGRHRSFGFGCLLLAAPGAWT